jgi:hypothetical protein
MTSNTLPELSEFKENGMITKTEWVMDFIVGRSDFQTQELLWDMSTWFLSYSQTSRFELPEFSLHLPEFRWSFDKTCMRPAHQTEPDSDHAADHQFRFIARSCSWRWET